MTKLVPWTLASLVSLALAFAAFRHDWPDVVTVLTGAMHTPAYFYHRAIKGEAPNHEKYFTSFKAVKKIWNYLPLPLTQGAGHLIYRWLC